jgi:hypothetical protein
MKNDTSVGMFKTESEIFKDGLYNNLKGKKPKIDHISTNFFVDNTDMYDMISPTPLGKPLTRSESAKRLNITPTINKQVSLDSFGDFKMPDLKSGRSIKKSKDTSPRSTRRRPESPIKINLNEEEKTPIIKLERVPSKKSEVSKTSSKMTPRNGKSAPEPKKKRKRRRDVIFKTILRECRRYYQIQLTELTGFISSKKQRTDDYMYRCMERFNKEFLNLNGSFDENFYLACLIYPQDLIRNLDIFLKHKTGKAKNKTLKQTAQKIHDTLYKYSHDKLDFFVGKPELAFLFCYFYEKGAGAEREDPKFAQEYEFIRSKCMESLNSHM